MLIRRPSDIVPSEITPPDVYLRRREFMTGVGAIAAGLALPAAAGQKLNAGRSAHSTSEPPTPLADVIGYNNFYEFGTDKSDPKALAHTLKTRPWTIQIDGAVGKPQTIGIDDLLKMASMEERIYRMRCVEGWSMVIPWVGFQLSTLIKKAEPTGAAKFVEFTTVHRPNEMIGQLRQTLEWPYVEGLRMDEAMNPLTLLALGLYGETLPNQNGAPVRLVVPWKYGFKSIKSISRIRLLEHQPNTSWSRAAPQEYGFFSNVNPEVAHPRWSQSRERRIGEFFKRPTLPFNGYGEYVSSMYAGLDLRKFF